MKGWIDYLGGTRAGEFRRLDRPVRDYDGERGVAAWMAAAERPWWAYNGNDHDVAIETFLLPPRSVSVNPGVEGGAVGWRSPVSGTVRVAGRLTDGDPYDGTGVAWAIDHLTKDGRHQLASGGCPTADRCGSIRAAWPADWPRSGSRPATSSSSRWRWDRGRALRHHERRADDLRTGSVGRMGPVARCPGGFPREQSPRRLIGASGRLAVRRHGREPPRRPAAGARPPAGRLGRGRGRQRTVERATRELAGAVIKSSQETSFGRRAPPSRFAAARREARPPGRTTARPEGEAVAELVEKRGTPRGRAGVPVRGAGERRAPLGQGPGRSPLLVRRPGSEQKPGAADIARAVAVHCTAAGRRAAVWAFPGCAGLHPGK